MSIPAARAPGATVRGLASSSTTQLRALVERAQGRFGVFELVGVLVLLGAALSPVSAPTVAGIAQETGRALPGSTAADAYVSVWSSRPAGPANIVELGAIVLAVLWIARFLKRGEVLSSFDVVVVGLAALITVVQLAAVLRGEPGLLYQRLDAERAAVFFVGYFAVSRMWLTAGAIRMVILGLAAVLAAVAAWLVLRHGLLGSTGFVASDGKRTALLITEDTLLVGFPVVLAWGLWIDRRITGAVALLALALAGGAVLVDLLSVRRASLLLLLAVLFVRGLWQPRRLGTLIAILAAVCAIGIAAGPGRSVARTAWYTAESVVLRTSNNSTSQREGELRNLAANMRGPDVLVGRGLGADWQAYGTNPVDIVAFGGGETAFVRVGWHIVGIEWLYKTGVLGVAGLLALIVLGALRARTGLRGVRDPVLRSAGWSLAVLSVVLLQNLFANPRLGFFAGVCVALVSKIIDLKPATPRPPAPRPPAQPAPTS